MGLGLAKCTCLSSIIVMNLILCRRYGEWIELAGRKGSTIAIWSIKTLEQPAKPRNFGTRCNDSLEKLDGYILKSSLHMIVREYISMVKRTYMSIKSDVRIERTRFRSFLALHVYNISKLHVERQIPFGIDVKYCFPYKNLKISRNFKRQ